MIGENIIGLLWGVLIAAALITVMYLIGNAIHDNNAQDQKYQIQCMTDGGHMEIVGNSFKCNKR